ncbi:MAG: carboxypeptidase-like regulatory domain-containing protein, partial [Bacteroidota bacterium]
MRKLLIFTCCLLAAFTTLAAQTKVTVKGYVKDASNGETLIGATVYLDGTTKGTTTNEYGFYSLTVDPGTYTLVATYLGYEDMRKDMELIGNFTVDFELKEAGTVLNEVVVTAEEEDGNVSEVQMSVENL